MNTKQLFIKNRYGFGENIVVESYLRKPFNRGEFKDIKNYDSCINKPKGGLWTSPKGSSQSWHDWCESEDFGIGHHKFNITLKKEVNLYIIDTNEDALRAPHKDLRMSFLSEKILDFEKIKEKGYDGIWLTDQAAIDLHLPEMKYDEYISFNAWDVDSVLLFNLDCIEKIEEEA